MKKILYIGEISDYVTELEKEISSKLPDCHFIFEENVSIGAGYNSVDKHRPAFIILSYRAERSLKRRFFHLINKVFGNITFIILAPNKETVVEVPKKSTLGDYIYWITNPEFEEIIDYLAKKLSVKSKQVIHFPKAYYTDNFDLYQCMRVSNMNRTQAQIETNRYFENGSIVDLNFPYHATIFNSDKHKLTQRSEAGLGSHFKYRYSLEYLLHTKKLSPNDRSKLIKDLRYEVSTKPINEEAYLAIIEATKEKKFSVAAPISGPTKKIDESDQYMKDLETLSQAIYFNWLVDESQKQGNHYQNYVTIYDRSKTLLNMDLKTLESNFTHFIHRQDIVNSNENMIKDSPSFIIVNIDEVNTIEKVKEMISGVTLLKDQFPLIILFNEKGTLSLDDLRHYLEYHFVVSTPNSPELQLILKMFKLYQEKRINKEIDKYKKTLRDLRDNYPQFYLFSEDIFINHKIFKEIDDPASLLIFETSAEIIWLSLTEMKFKTTTLLNPGEIFRVKTPIDMQLEILTREDSLQSFYEYTAHLHFITHFDRINIKQFINRISNLNKQEKTISKDDLQLIKQANFQANISYGI